MEAYFLMYIALIDHMGETSCSCFNSCRQLLISVGDA